MEWNPTAHAANSTDEYVFHQLIPYIGNKRKLLGLIGDAVFASRARPETHLFVDLFAGTGVVGRYARRLGFGVLANDWEPYAEELNRCYLEISQAPVFFGSRPYSSVLSELNALPPLSGWVTEHLCPRDDEHFDVSQDRLFYMRKNGQRIDAIREQIAAWEKEGRLDPGQRAALLAPLLYQCCYNANTSGVFKGFHNGWGGRTGTALYRIKGDLVLRPACFLDNGRQSRVLREDAQALAERLRKETAGAPTFVYLDPPYNQHPYGSNYHVLNSVALWDKPPLSPRISGYGDKAAIRTDWRESRRSAYNERARASKAYEKLLETLAGQTKIIATSYSSDGMIPLRALIEANAALGAVILFTRPYKRYRVSSQRRSLKPMNVEFVLLTEVGREPFLSVDEIEESIQNQDKDFSSGDCF